MPIYFYKEFGPLGYLANYSNHGFYKDGVYYQTVEHFYQSQKFLDENLRKKIIDAKTPKEASNIGRDRNNKLRDNWKEIKQGIMLEGVLEKFRQNSDILSKLLDTGDEEIIENTVDEYYWGCGKTKTGENNFGKIVVKAREILRIEKLFDLEYLKSLDSIYIIGHNNIDVDSYFSSYILSKILISLGVNAHFAIIDNYIYSLDDKDLIEDYLKEKPIILNKNEIKDKNFILVDHNDTLQSINNNANIICAIDHHIDSKKVKKCYSVEYASTLLYIYKIFKQIYKFNDYEKNLIALSVMADSEYLTSTRFKEKDKLLFDELNTNLDSGEIRKKYFKTTDFTLDIDHNIMANYKVYNIENYNVHRIILKAYEKDKNNLDLFLSKIKHNRGNWILIWNEYDTNKTLIYYKTKLVKEYDYILTSSVIIIKDLIKNKIFK